MASVVILAGSPRPNGNSMLMAQSFAEVAGLHHEVSLFSVADLNVAPCRGCNACFDNGHHCVQQDDMRQIYDKLAKADVLVLASPVYFYGISAQLAAVVNRLHNPLRDSFHITKAALLLSAASRRPQICDAIKLQYTMLLDNFHIENLGIVAAQGVGAAGDILSTDYLAQVRELATLVG